ncbi:MAG: PilZ domain-containing protein [Acidobacteriaceae bacterium]|nr:PilZ domain-containing protein [Acidobacteriaceae bacterium]
MIEQRKAKRFQLQLPFELVRSGPRIIHQIGETKNLSSVGVLFAAQMQMEIGDPVEYFITLPTPPDADPVRIRCLGKIVRAEGAVVAATLERYEFVRVNQNAGGEKPQSRFSQPRKVSLA